jgi:PST family polysaccharide transporter
VDLSGIIANAAVALSLAIAGYGPLALAWGILVGNLVTVIGIILVAPERPRPGYNAGDARALLSTGLPLAGASLLVFATLNVDYFVIGGLLDVEALGFYLLAFNLASWPPNLLTAAIRSVSIPAFSQLASNPDRLYRRFTGIFGVVMTLTLPIAALLSILASHVIGVLYGTQWLPAALALVVLAPLGVARIGLNLFYDLFVAIGRSRTVLWLQTLWIVVLIPAMLLGAGSGGIRGVAIAHVVVAFFIVAPAFAVALRRAGVPLGPLAATLGRPLLAMVAMVGVVFVVDRLIDPDPLALVVGGVAGAVIYGAAVVNWRNRRPDLAGTLGAFQDAGTK